MGFMVRLLSVILIFVVAFLGFYVWFDWYDVTGLELYDNQPISDILLYDDEMYITTEDGFVFVSGNYHSSSRKYRNSESYYNDKLSSSVPVLINNNKIVKIIPYGALKTLLIDEENQLFDFNDFQTRKVYDDVGFAIKAPQSQGKKIFGDDSKELYYIIDTNDTLLAINGDNKSRELFLDVSQVNYYLDTILVLDKCGTLNQYSISDNGDIILKETLYENVASFDVENTSVRFDGEKLVYDESAMKLPLVNVLTNEGELYVKGAYNLLCCTSSMPAHPEPKIIYDWLLIAEQVESFSLAPMGTIIKYKNNTAGYYGFDTDNSHKQSYEFGYIPFELTEVVDVYADDVQVLIKTKEKFYAWGFSLIFDGGSSEHNLFHGTPIVISP